MKAVIQRVKKAGVSIDGEVYSKIGSGLLILLGVCKDDKDEYAQFIAKKIADLRIFSDAEGKMNLSVKDINGEILVISQFTLCSDKDKSGNRPSFMKAELPERAERIYRDVVNELSAYYNKDKIRTGVFAASMEVELVNDGPVTIIIEK
ncbi:MAG TPA: D-aminoacyl-tRNA deacylase [Ignavibacteria bacterium]|nr:D-aminoacyl-tRNA deacylase [Ignavibacteria bacterium]HMR40130.1 D-aminoacyl-tRNA deacylase [Ignavibacteria bacterium]